MLAEAWIDSGPESLEKHFPEHGGWFYRALAGACMGDKWCRFKRDASPRPAI